MDGINKQLRVPHFPGMPCELISIRGNPEGRCDLVDRKDLHVITNIGPITSKRKVLNTSPLLIEVMSAPAKKVRKSQALIKTLPNILITGTPGTGKSTLSKAVGEKSGLKWISIGDFAKEKGFLGDYDEELECHELEEDPLLDELEDLIGAGGVIVDHHVTDFFPERYFDIVFVLRTDNAHLHDRLKARDYNEKKLQNNLECEIFQTILDEAKSSYDENIVHELPSNEESDIESNLQRILAWIDQWKSDNNTK